LSERYGKAVGIVGRGSYGLVKVASKRIPGKEDKLFAIKELKKKKDEKDDHFSNRLISEFLISSSLKHQNIVKVFDLMKSNLDIFSEVMEYCEAGDLYSLISQSHGLHYLEADCFIKQILSGVSYIHSSGIAHCDLKPENILLTINGCCKIIDFGTSVVFCNAWEDDIHLSNGAVGSTPYVAPEEYDEKDYDPRLADIWSLGVIYVVMRIGSYIWATAKETDEHYKEYIDTRKSNLKGGDPTIMISRRNALYKVLEPNVEKRLSANELLRTDWVSSTEVCKSG
ncbi:serine/threonine-protein kinase, partial [Ascoidea rubescens DSM 1968]